MCILFQTLFYLASNSKYLIFLEKGPQISCNTGVNRNSFWTAEAVHSGKMLTLWYNSV